MDAEPGTFDLHAAWTRKAQGDAGTFAEALAARLTQALPGSVEVQRRRDGLFSTASHVARIIVRFDTRLLTLELERGHFVAKRAKVVRGVTIGSEAISIPAWIEDVVGETRALGERAGAAHGTLHDFLMS